jgi:hypothetical protein
MRATAAIAALIALCLFAATAGAAVPSGSPALYVATGHGYSIAFKVANAKVYVLGLDATVYCQTFAPRAGREQGERNFFAAPKLMGQTGEGPLGAFEGAGSPHGLWQVTVAAELEAEKVVGSFQYGRFEEREDCGTAGYGEVEPKVPFEAVRYEPADRSPPPPPFASAEPAFYYGAEGPVETFFTVSTSRLILRGDVASACQPAKKLRAVGRGALSRGDLEASLLIGGGSFRGVHSSLDSYGPRWPRETVAFGGEVGDKAIIGTYRRRIAIGFDGKRKRVCHTGPLPFQAQRYLPATP